jgi:hypothetical protein
MVHYEGLFLHHLELYPAATHASIVMGPQIGSHNPQLHPAAVRASIIQGFQYGRKKWLQALFCKDAHSTVLNPYPPCLTPLTSLPPRMCSSTFACTHSNPARWVLLEAAGSAVTIEEAVRARSQFEKDVLWALGAGLF